MRLQGDNGFIEILILGRSNNKSVDYWESNWLNSEIQIKIQAGLSEYSIQYTANLRVDEFKRFNNELSSLICLKNIIAEFKSLEENIYMICELKTNGAVYCNVKTQDEDAFVDLKIHTDLISLENFSKEITRTLKIYPLLGV